MQTTQLSTSPGGAPTANGVITIRTPVGGPVPGIFREVRYLRLSIGAGVEEIAIDPAACDLDASFLSYTYNAIPASAGGLRASVTDTSNGLVVSLDAPRRIREITVGAFLTVGGPYKVELYRLDGNVPSDEPSFTANAKSNVKIDGIARSGRGARKSTSSGNGGSGGGGEVMAMMMGGGADPGAQAILAENETLVVIMGADNEFDVDFTDQRFLVKVRGQGGQLANLGTSDLKSVIVESYPRSPRVGLAFPAPGAAADPQAANFFWRAPGEIGNGAPLADGQVDEGATLGAELARAAARYAEALRDQAAEGAAPTLPANLDVALVIESDAPCRFDLDALRVDYRLARTSFPDGAEKLVLRFPGGIVVTRDIPLSLPAGVSVTAATLEVVESLRSDRAGAAGAAGAATATLPTTRKGVRIHREMQAAQPLTPPKASTVTGLTIGLIALESGSSGRVELREDAEGSPSGRVLGKGTVAPAAVGRAEWSVVRFDDVAIVPSSPHWVVLTCDAGTMVWLTTEAEDLVHLRRLSGTDDWATTSILRDVRTLHDLLSTGGSEAGVTSLGLTIADAAFPAGSASGDRTAFDMTAPLNGYLAANAGQSGVLSIPVRCTALGPGSVTVYPPRIEFER